MLMPFRSGRIGDVRLHAPRLPAQARDDSARHDGGIRRGVGGGPARRQYRDEEGVGIKTSVFRLL